MFALEHVRRVALASGSSNEAPQLNRVRREGLVTQYSDTTEIQGRILTGDRCITRECTALS